MRSELGLELGSEGRAVPLSSESRQAGHTYAREDRLAVVLFTRTSWAGGNHVSWISAGGGKRGREEFFSLNGSVFCHGSRIRCKTGH